MILSKTKTCYTIIMLKTMSHMILNFKPKSFGNIFTIHLMKLM